MHGSGDDPGHGGADAPPPHLGCHGDRRARDGQGRLFLGQADAGGGGRQRALLRAQVQASGPGRSGRDDRDLEMLRLRHRLRVGTGGHRRPGDRPRPAPRDEAEGRLFLHPGRGGPAGRRDLYRSSGDEPRPRGPVAPGTRRCGAILDPAAHALPGERGDRDRLAKAALGGKAEPGAGLLRGEEQRSRAGTGARHRGVRGLGAFLGHPLR